jgi:hypothetical protein
MKRALAPVQFANSRINIGDPWKRAPGLKPGIQSDRYRRTEVRRSPKTKSSAAKHFFRKLFSRRD